jgi:hypothetical protein
MTQYLSRADRPVGSMPPGWMNERVNLSDWAEGVGEIFHGSCWCETSMMLVWSEIPGIYAHTDTGFLCVFDHVEAVLRERNGDGITVEMSNPTRYPARVKVYSERSTDLGTPLERNFLYGCPVIRVEPGETVLARITTRSAEIIDSLVLE